MRAYSAIQEFLPTKSFPCRPLLREWNSLVAVLMGWEGPGSWIYPGSFPPVGGEESLKNFARLARQRGWRLGTFCCGTRWVTGYYWNGYDEREDFFRLGGEKSVCREANGSLWVELWDQGWWPSYDCCLGTELTRALAVEYVRQLIGCGLGRSVFRSEPQRSPSRASPRITIIPRWAVDERRWNKSWRCSGSCAGPEKPRIHSAEAG
jgi:hypothetical protein